MRFNDVIFNLVIIIFINLLKYTVTIGTYSLYLTCIYYIYNCNNFIFVLH